MPLQRGGGGDCATAHPALGAVGRAGARSSDSAVTLVQFRPRRNALGALERDAGEVVEASRRLDRGADWASTTLARVLRRRGPDARAAAMRHRRVQRVAARDLHGLAALERSPGAVADRQGEPRPRSRAAPRIPMGHRHGQDRWPELELRERRRREVRARGRGRAGGRGARRGAPSW